MSNQKISNKNRRVVLLATVFAVTAIVLVGLANVVPLFASQAHENDLQNTDSENHTIDNDRGIEVGKGLRTKDNTGCVNPPNGPMIC